MLEEVFCTASSEAQARGIMSRIERIGIAPERVCLATQTDGIEQIVHPAVDLQRAVKFGLIIGAVVGWHVGVGVLVSLGASLAGYWNVALLLPASMALGGTVLGALFGATGAFSQSRMSAGLERHYAEEIDHGRILIAVELKDAAKVDDVVAAVTDEGAADIHFATEKAA
ncbi:MAG: hypothetical protein HY646_04700 [Acidobacteria bacterium]|nr:hypothetical protein [Acidobacteriota bacterium]